MSSAAIRFELRRAYADGIGPAFAFSPAVHGSGLVHPIAATAEYERFGGLGFSARSKHALETTAVSRAYPSSPSAYPSAYP